jgi:hypothetical protein
MNIPESSVRHINNYKRIKAKNFCRRVKVGFFCGGGGGPIIFGGMNMVFELKCTVYPW